MRSIDGTGHGGKVGGGEVGGNGCVDQAIHGDAGCRAGIRQRLVDGLVQAEGDALEGARTMSVIVRWAHEGSTKRAMATKELISECETAMTCVIDEFLSDIRYCTIVEGWKVRDLLLDLRNILDESATRLQDF